MTQYYITLDSSFAHAARHNEGYVRGYNFVRNEMKKTEFRHPHLKEDLMC